MVYIVESGKIGSVETDHDQTGDGRHLWGVFTFEEFAETGRNFGLEPNAFASSFDNRAIRFESHDGFDFICVNVLSYKNVALPFARVYIYVSKHLLFFITDKPPMLLEMIKEISSDQTKGVGFEKLFYFFFDKITSDDADFLEEIEQEISDLENDLILSKRKSCVGEIMYLRKRLMALKRYYEQLLHVWEDMQENENNLIDAKSMRYFKIFAGRVDRLYHSVLNLRDYVTQVREAYQAEVDISLNNVMKLFTVLTAFFLPLTLIVGWYGMNLKMPEFTWAYGYPMVIGLCVAVVAFCFYYFKKHKWF